MNRIDENIKLRSMVEDKSIFLPELIDIIVLMDNSVINGEHYYKGKMLDKINSQYSIFDNCPDIESRFSMEFIEELNDVFFSDLIRRLMVRKDCVDFMSKYARKFEKSIYEYSLVERIEFFKDCLDVFDDFKICVFTICIEPVRNLEMFCYDLYITHK